MHNTKYVDQKKLKSFLDFFLSTTLSQWESTLGSTQASVDQTKLPININE